MTNPLLDTTGLPLFDQIAPEHVAPALDVLLADAEKALDTVTANDFPAAWQSIAQTLDVATERLGMAWGAVSHLNSVADTPELRAAYNAALPRVTEFWTRLGSDERLYAKYKAIDPASLNAEQKQAQTNALRAFVLGGAELQGADKTRYADIQERLAEITQKFSENTLDATDSFALYVSEDQLKGVPADVMQATRDAAQKEGKEGHRLSLKMPVYLPVMQFADSSALREQLYKAHVTRASDQASEDAKHFDNTALMQEILALRKEEARLLGFDNYAQVSVVPKMAESPEKVTGFLRDLAVKARPFAEKDLADLREFAANALGLSSALNAWDIPYLSEKLKEARYSFSEQEVKQYFTAPKVLAGLFKIIETLFEVNILPDQAPVWHPAVAFYRIERDGQLVGQFYLDPPARAGKRGGAWMDDVRGRWQRPDTGVLQTPVAHLVCNFAEGVNGQPALLTHDDVITLFHEFGHGLHHMLTQVNERDVSGISGVEWDAVELPSQFMENWCWTPEGLALISGHVDSGEPLPQALLDRLLAARNFQSGLMTLRQLEFSIFDLEIHRRADIDFAAMLRVLDEVRDTTSLLRPPAWNRFPCSFTHIFAGGYAAGYYSYKWAEVLSADAFSAFEREGVFNADTGRRFRQAILAQGGSRPAAELFREFMGRDPSPEALLRHSGLLDAAA